MKKLLFILLTITLVCFGCRTPRSQVQIRTIEKEVERLVPYALPADSSAIEALFECDSTNQVRMKELSELKTKGWQSYFHFDKGLFRYKVLQPPDTVRILAKDKYISQDVPVEVVKEIPIYKQTDMQIVFGWFGKVFMGLLGFGTVIGLVILILKWKRLY